MRILILSDGKAGHLNQSIAFAKLKNWEYDVLELQNNYKFLTYILDFLHVYIDLFSLHVKQDYNAVVCAGSATYYAGKYLAKKLDIKVIAVMLPRGFRYGDFDYIIAQSHDAPPKRANIIEIPINFSTSEATGVLEKSSKNALGVIIGGSNSVFDMQEEQIKNALDAIFANYPEHLKYLTTSRRTPPQIERLVAKYPFDYALIYSANPTCNPIGDFIAVCDEIFVSIDSTSMLSEVKANTDATLHIIDLKAKSQDTKYHKLAQSVRDIKGRFDYAPYLRKVQL